MLAKDHTKKQLMEMMPCLSTYSIDQARLHASIYGEGKLVHSWQKKSLQFAYSIIEFVLEIHPSYFILN